VLRPVQIGTYQLLCVLLYKVYNVEEFCHNEDYYHGVKSYIDPFSQSLKEIIYFNFWLLFLEEDKIWNIAFYYINVFKASYTIKTVIVLFSLLTANKWYVIARYIFASVRGLDFTTLFSYSVQNKMVSLDKLGGYEGRIQFNIITWKDTIQTSFPFRGGFLSLTDGPSDKVQVTSDLYKMQIFSRYLFVALRLLLRINIALTRILYMMGSKYIS